MGNGRVDRTPSFASGDPRFIYAARRDTSELVLLPHGQAEAFRELARTQLMCPVRGCPAPQVTTVGGDRRHHYRHLVKAASTDHSPETWHHLEAKQVLEAWAKERYPGAIVEQEKVLGSRDRIADVFVTLPDGSRYAIEVQFSSLTTDQFRERHRWYRDAGIVDVWLFIHAGVQLRQDWDRTLRVTYSPTHHAVAQTGAPMFWVNPQQKMIGYATRTINVGGHTYRTHADREGEFHTEPLEDFTLSPTGMTSDALAAIDADSNAARAAIETAARAHAAAEERRQQDLVRRAHAVERAASSKRLAAGERSTIRAEILVRWESSSEGRDALEQFGGLLLPMWLLDDGDLEVTIPGRVWKWRLVRTRVLPLQSGQYLTASLLLRELNLTYPGVFPQKTTERELDLMLRALILEGLLTRVPLQPGYYTAVPAVEMAGQAEREVPAGQCLVCRGPLAKEIPGMRVHFGDCERRATNLSRGSRSNPAHHERGCSRLSASVAG